VRRSRSVVPCVVVPELGLEFKDTAYCICTLFGATGYDGADTG
jgi:hypothetical protein